jgi:2-dehydro-3-deoxyphosphooctonate aldolase (KDO 8-P synthase)
MKQLQATDAEEDLKTPRKRVVNVGSISCGSPQLFLISGPCVIEQEHTMLSVAERLAVVSQRLGIPVIFKSSFLKDNRSDASYYRGPGLDEGLRTLEKVRHTFGFPLLSDVHYPTQTAAAAEVLDVLQIPAYLCMQTELLESVAATGRVVNLKRGQFLSPAMMQKPIAKVESAGNTQILVTERGFTFGYNDLVVDPRSFHDLQQTGYPVVFDVTHSVRRYGIPSADPAGGSREYLAVLARSAAAAGIDGLFIETHPHPAEALCDAASQLSINHLEDFLKPLLEIHNLINTYRDNNGIIS